MIIGLTGKNGVGKGEVARILGEKGFHYTSLSDIIRDELRARGLEPTRENLIEMGNELRRRFGPGILAERTLARLERDKNYLVDSIRNPAEVEALRRCADFVLVNVDAPEEVRLERVRRRRRPDDPITLEEFRRLEQKELYSEDEHGQQLARCIEMADFTIVNDGTLEELRAEVEKLLRALVGRFPRPGWDEYFMRIAKIVAMRSNCIRRKVAAIIVKENRIISTGYNGTPRGAVNCDEGGCPRCNSFPPAGTRLDECLCSHAEENAIVQAAYHGTSVKGATLYTTFSPCLLCAKMIINSGIVEVVYGADYPLNDAALALFEQTHVKVRRQAVD